MGECGADQGDEIVLQPQIGDRRRIPPPIGIEIKQLPHAAEMVKVKGQQYFAFNDIYYQALYGGSGNVYKVVEDPNS